MFGIPLKGRYCLVALIEPDSLDDVINSQRYKAETDLPVYTAQTIVLHTVEKKYEERHDTRHEDKHRYDSQNLGVHPLQSQESFHPFLPTEM